MHVHEKQLKNYQEDGVAFLLSPLTKEFPRLKRMLAFDMGLGKTPITVEALKRLSHIYKFQLGRPRVLVVCPYGQKLSWKQHFIDWGYCTPQSVFVWGTNQTMYSPNVVTIINFEQFSKHRHESVWESNFDVIVIDESQRLSSMNAMYTVRILGWEKPNLPPLISTAKRVWFLSGTPTKNKIIDLYPVLRSSAPECMKGKTDFIQFGKYFCNGWWDEDLQDWDFSGASHTDELWEAMKPFMFRLSADDAGEELPEVIERKVYCQVEIAEDKSNSAEQTIRKALGKAKVPFLVEHINETLGKTNKVMVVCYNKDVMDLLGESLPDTYYKGFIRGGQSDIIRKSTIRLFQEQKNKSVLIVQVKAGGEGTDGLQLCCNRIINAQPEWTLLDAQVIGRLKRIGQPEGRVYVDRVLVPGRESQDMAIHYEREKKERNVKPLFKTNREVEKQMPTIEDIAVGLISDIAKAAEKAAVSLKSLENGNGKSETVVEKKETAPAGKKAPAAKITMDDVREKTDKAIETLEGVLGDLPKAKDLIRALVKKHGADKLAKLEPSKFAAYLKDLEEAMSDKLTADTGADNEV